MCRLNAACAGDKPGEMQSQAIHTNRGKKNMDKKTLNQIVRARGGKVDALNNKTTCYELPGTEENEIWFYAFRDKIIFNNMIMHSQPKLVFNVYWDMIL